MKNIKKPVLILLCISAIACSMNALGADFQTGLLAYKSGDYATALREWKPLAEQGDAEAQYDLGQMYRKGQGVVQNDQMAAQWYRLAVEQGYAKAQNNLGWMYERGQGVPKNYIYAHLLFNLAAASGHQNAAKNRDIVANLMSLADIAEAQRLAQQCLASGY